MPQADPDLPYTRLGAMREDRGRFAGLRDARILLYWPHGLGDWAHLGYVVPLLEPSNTYAATRFGDDYVSIADGCGLIEPLYSGVLPPGDGADRGARHFGITQVQCDGGLVTMALPPPLDDALMSFAPEAMLWTDYPETEGRSPFPFHTKARNLVRLLTDSQRLAQLHLSLPLRNALDFRAAPGVQRKVDERLASFAPPGTRVCVVSRTGYTAARKNWGDGSEARAFVALVRRSDPRWRVISMEDEPLGDRCAGYRALFGELDEPFARTFKALAARTALFAGVPAGPLHVMLARGGVPVVGLWLAHHPDWYDEPNPAAVHVVGRLVRDRGFHRRPATTTKPPAFRDRVQYMEKLEIPAERVLDAAREAGAIS
jgi:hypothetical protein